MSNGVPSIVQLAAQHDRLPRVSCPLTGRLSRARGAADTSSVLYKHKQYLAHLQKDIKLQKAEEAAMETESEEKRKRFVERSAQLRDAIRAGLLATGDAYAALNQPDQALKFYKAAIDASDNSFTSPKYLFKAGMISAELNKKSEALAYFKRIEIDFPEAQEANQIQIQIGRLEVQ